jgi:hypothetical protein
MFRSSLVATAAVAAFCTLSGCAPAADSNADAAAASEAAPNAALTAELANLRTANERFNDVNVALAEGYIADPSGMCVTADMVGEPIANGSMGLHYLRPDLLGLVQGPGRVNGTGTYTDFTKPAVLMYEPQADGTLKLVGIENLVWKAAWLQAGNTAPPSFQGQTWFEMTDNPDTPVDEAHGFEPHYDLHVWLYRDSPSGVFSQFNPAVSCEYGKHPPKTQP